VFFGLNFSHLTNSALMSNGLGTGPNFIRKMEQAHPQLQQMNIRMQNLTPTLIGLWGKIPH